MRSGACSRFVGLGLVAVTGWSCSGASTAPSGGPTEVGPNATNTPPTIISVSVTPPRENQPASLATIGDSIALSADVVDPDTALDRLDYIWSAVPPLGAFSGDGVSVRWSPPPGWTRPLLSSWCSP